MTESLEALRERYLSVKKKSEEEIEKIKNELIERYKEENDYYWHILTVKSEFETITTKHGYFSSYENAKKYLEFNKSKESNYIKHYIIQNDLSKLSNEHLLKLDSFELPSEHIIRDKIK